MTKTRYTYLQNDLVLADSGEYTFPITSGDNITRLDFEFKATNGATNNKAAHIADIITSIDLMNGSEPILSLSGYELGGMVVGRSNRMVQGLVSEVLSEVQYMRFAVDFGRWYGDEQFSLDLSRFDNIQVRIKWNLAAIRAVGATGFVTGTGRFTCIAHIMEGAATPVGYLSMKRHALFTTAASGVYPIVLPTDKIIRSMGIRSYEAGTGLLSGISHLRISNNEGKEYPIDLDVDDLLESVVMQYAPVGYKHRFHGKDTDVFYTLLKYHEQVSLVNELTDTVSEYVNTGIGQGTHNQFTASTGAALAVDHTVSAMVHGYLPFSLAYLPFGTYDNPDSWFNAPMYKGSKLELTQDNAGAATSLVLEQVNMY